MMKARPVKNVNGCFVECTPEEATHLQMHFPGPLRFRQIPVITKGSRSGTNAWTWNGDICFPTIMPSVLTQITLGNKTIVCHSWVSSGYVQFLADSTHPLSGHTVELLDIENTSMFSDDLDNFDHPQEKD